MIKLTPAGNNVWIEVDGRHVGICQNMNANTVQGEARYALAVGLYFPHSFEHDGSALVSEMHPSSAYSNAVKIGKDFVQNPSLWRWTLSERL